MLRAGTSEMSARVSLDLLPGVSVDGLHLEEKGYDICLVPGIWIGRKSGVIEERMAAIYVGPLPISHFLWRRS
jgi:hypothetical protein